MCNNNYESTIQHFNLIPKTQLGFFPTPLSDLPKLSKYLGGPKIFIKRDDQSGLAMGGNKTRKLEYLMSDALHQKSSAVLTAGAVQSNHCRQTAAAAAFLGMECHLVLGGSKPDHPTGNLFLDLLMGSQIHWSGHHRKGEDLPAIYEHLKSKGKNPYIIPYGGSNVLGVLGFIAAAKELNVQSKSLPFTHVIFASSSGGTQAGLIIGKKFFKETYTLLGINVEKEEPGHDLLRQQILTLLKETASFLGHPHQFGQEEILLNSAYTGSGYGIVGEQEQEAIKLMAQTEGILLDPVYTGRAMGGLIDMIIKKEIDSKARVLFWHTGGTPALFAHTQDIV